MSATDGAPASGSETRPPGVTRRIAPGALGNKHGAVGPGRRGSRDVASPDASVSHTHLVEPGRNRPRLDVPCQPWRRPARPAKRQTGQQHTNNDRYDTAILRKNDHGTASARYLPTVRPVKGYNARHGDEIAAQATTGSGFARVDMADRMPADAIGQLHAKLAGRAHEPPCAPSVPHIIAVPGARRSPRAKGDVAIKGQPEGGSPQVCPAGRAAISAASSSRIQELSARSSRRSRSSSKRHNLPRHRLGTDLLREGDGDALQLAVGMIGAEPEPEGLAIIKEQRLDFAGSLFAEKFDILCLRQQLRREAIRITAPGRAREHRVRRVPRYDAPLAARSRAVQPATTKLSMVITFIPASPVSELQVYAHERLQVFFFLAGCVA